MPIKRKKTRRSIDVNVMDRIGNIEENQKETTEVVNDIKVILAGIQTSLEINNQNFLEGIKTNSNRSKKTEKKLDKLITQIITVGSIITITIASLKTLGVI